MIHQEMRVLRKNTLTIPDVDISTKKEKRSDFSYSKKNKPIIPATNPVEVLAIPDMKRGTRRRGSLHPAALSVFSFRPENKRSGPSDENEPAVERSTLDESKGEHMTTKVAKI